MSEEASDKHVFVGSDYKTCLQQIESLREKLPGNSDAVATLLQQADRSSALDAAYLIRFLLRVASALASKCAQYETARQVVESDLINAGHYSAIWARSLKGGE